MKFGKISFFKRIYLAITDFRMYPFIQKEKLTTAIGYFLKLIILMSIIMGAFLTINIFREIPTLISLCERNLPDFTIENGVIDTAENVTKEINDEWYLVVNDEVKYSDLENITFEEKEEHPYYVLVLSDTTIVCMRAEDEIYEIGGIMYDSNMNFNKMQMVDTLEEFYESTGSRIIIWIGVSCGIIFALTIIRLWTLVMYMISAYILNIMFGLKLKITDYLRIAIYTSTLPFILEMIAILVVGSISESINFISILVSCVYIFYALRALKLDSLILGGKGKSAAEKLEDALNRAQIELEKQLEELKKENKEISEEELIERVNKHLEKEDKELKKEAENNKLSKEEEEALNKEIKEKEENLLKAQREYQEAVEKVCKKIEDKEEEQDKK